MRRFTENRTLVNDRNRNFRPKPEPEPKSFRFGSGSVILTRTGMDILCYDTSHRSKYNGKKLNMNFSEWY